MDETFLMALANVCGGGALPLSTAFWYSCRTARSSSRSAFVSLSNHPRMLAGGAAAMTVEKVSFGMA